MEIDKDTVRHVAKTARLDLTEEEVERFEKELKEVLKVFSTIDKADVEGVEPSILPVEIHDALREDKPTGCLSQEDTLANSKHVKDGYFKGPKAV